MSRRRTTWYAVTAVLAGALVAAVAAEWPEINRYLKMSRM